MLFRLALKNLFGSGLRTWLNVISLSIVFVTILIVHGFYTGVFSRIEENMIRCDVAGGQYWSEGYDPQDVLGIDSCYQSYTDFMPEIEAGTATPILIRSGYLYSDANMQGILIKGIDRHQTLLDVPSDSLAYDPDLLHAYIGHVMARHTHLKEGDRVMLRFRDKHEANTAMEARIDKIVHFPIQSIDIGQIWVDLESLQVLSDMKDQATIVTVKAPLERRVDHWTYQGMDVMLESLYTWKAQEETGAYVIMALLLGMAVLAIFDTQMLSIFRRKKEIGTLVAVGMRKQRVVWLFTLEGLLYAVFALVIGAIPGIPLLYLLNKNGIQLGNSMEDFGMNIASTIWPEFSWAVIAGAAGSILVLVVLVSYLAAKRISNMNIVRILKGK